MTDSKNRAELSSLLSLGVNTLDELIQSEESVAEHLQSEDITRSWKQTTKTLQEVLQHQKCPIVVAGRITKPTMDFCK